MNIKSKIIIILLVGLALLLVTVILPTNATTPSNIVVNSSNGDIAFCYLDTSSSVSYLKVCAYSNDGEKLFSKRIFTDGGAYADLLYFGEHLYVYVGLTQKTYYYDRSGNKCEVDANAVRMVKESEKLEGWKFGFGKYTYTLGEHTYTYEFPTLFRRKARLIFSNGEESKQIFEFSKKN